MKEILQVVLEAQAEAKTVAVLRKPDGTQSEAYLLGYFQGKHAGITEVLAKLEALFEGQDRDAG